MRVKARPSGSGPPLASSAPVRASVSTCELGVILITASEGRWVPDENLVKKGAQVS